jgi:phage head maturation protease
MALLDIVPGCEVGRPTTLERNPRIVALTHPPEDPTCVVVRGYAALTGVPSAVQADGARLQFGPNAFAKSLPERARCLWNHFGEMPIAYQYNGGLTLGVNRYGLHFEIALPTYDRHAGQVLAGFPELRGVSFSHTEIGEGPNPWVNVGGNLWEMRRCPRITEISLCVGVEPAFPATRAHLRLWDPRYQEWHAPN